MCKRDVRAVHPGKGTKAVKRKPCRKMHESIVCFMAMCQNYKSQAIIFSVRNGKSYIDVDHKEKERWRSFQQNYDWHAFVRRCTKASKEKSGESYAMLTMK